MRQSYGDLKKVGKPPENASGVLYRTSFGDILRAMHGCVFDTECIGSDRQIDFFQHPAGSPDGSGLILGKEWGVETNMTQEGCLTVPDRLHILGFHVHARPEAAELIAFGGLQFIYTGNRIFYTIPVSQILTPAKCLPNGEAIQSFAEDRLKRQRSEDLDCVGEDGITITNNESFSARLSIPQAVDMEKLRGERVVVSILGIRFLAL